MDVDLLPTAAEKTLKNKFEEFIYLYPKQRRVTNLGFSVVHISSAFWIQSFVLVAHICSFVLSLFQFLASQHYEKKVLTTGSKIRNTFTQLTQAPSAFLTWTKYYEKLPQKHEQKKTKQGWSPEHFAAKFGNIEQLRRSFKQGKNINTKDATGQTLLQTAVRYDQVDTALFLIKQGASVTGRFLGNLSVLDLAVLKGHCRLIGPIMNQGVEEDSSGLTALHIAALHPTKNSKQVIKTILLHQREVNQKDNRKYTALAYACAPPSPSPTSDHIKPRYSTKMHLIDTLLAEEADSNFSSPLEIPLLHLVYNRKEDRARKGILRLLLSYKQTDHNQQDLQGNTLLHLAAKYNEIWLVQVLALHGKVDSAIKNNQGLTAWDLVESRFKKKSNNEEMSFFFLETGWGKHTTEEDLIHRFPPTPRLPQNV